ncbi:hypothetical protein MJ391_25330 [Escherichia coli]|nr:hypothetical protein MJ391_25330 [Escherichia coli]
MKKSTPAKEAQDGETLDAADALEQKEMPEELPLDAGLGHHLHRWYTIRHQR